MRAPGILSRLQSEMRSGCITDEMWDLYMSRVMTPDDSRLSALGSPFVAHTRRFIVHRHKIRVMRSFENAKDESRKLNVPLYVLQANDEVVRSEDRRKLSTGSSGRFASPCQSRANQRFAELFASPLRYAALLVLQRLCSPWDYERMLRHLGGHRVCRR